MFDESLTYSDVLIKPQFSFIESRNQVTLDHTFLNMNLGLPVISSNMDTVTGPKMAATLSKVGGVAALHRFQPIDKNVEQFYESIDLSSNSIDSTNYNKKPIVSFGIGDLEYERAITLVEAGAETLLLDVAHGASINVVKQYDKVRSKVGSNVKIIVGNFDNNESLVSFLYHIKSKQNPDAIKVGVGNGGACITRIVTGCGGGMISALMSCSRSNIPLIADGGVKSIGDIAKALAAGASSVMLGSMLASTDAAPGETVYGAEDGVSHPVGKRYRGSASLESYKVQGKVAAHRTAEGEAMVLPYTGTTIDLLSSISAGLKSACAYVGAKNLKEFKDSAELVKVSLSTLGENGAHSKKD